MEIGAFYFGDMGDGCIARRYFNDGTMGATSRNPNAGRAIFSETCIRTQLDTAFPEDLFCGIFTNTWIEADGVHEASLVITRHQTADGIYKLEWRDQRDGRANNNNIPSFHGRGMITDGLLMGYYTGGGLPVGGLPVEE